MKVGRAETVVIGTNKDTDIHCYIVICTMGSCQFFDLDSKMRNTTVLENYGKVVIGKALVSLDSLDKGKGIFYEAILFDKA